MAVYTKTGDGGETSLANGSRVRKTDARIEAYGTVDELNSWLGALRAELHANDLFASVDEQLEWVQNKLFNLGAELSCAEGEWIIGADVAKLEQWIDAMQETIPRQKAFLLPAGGEAVCRCHICRTICRRAERRIMEAEPILKKAQKHSSDGLKFMNRLSDYLFVLARYIGYKRCEKEAIWCKN